MRLGCNWRWCVFVLRSVHDGSGYLEFLRLRRVLRDGGCAGNRSFARSAGRNSAAPFILVCDVTVPRGLLRMSSVVVQTFQGAAAGGGFRELSRPGLQGG